LSYVESQRTAYRSPSVFHPESILAQSTPRKKASTSQKVQSTPPAEMQTPRSQTSILGTSSPCGSSFSRDAHTLDTFAMKRPSQTVLSQFDERVKLKEAHSIITNFDPEKDKDLYNQAIDIYKSFSRHGDDASVATQ